MAWSIFANGNAAAVQWAKDLLHAIGAPVTYNNVQVIYDWEKSEGGGGINNPLNQGPDTVHSGLSTSGSQYGGGAANYKSIAAGIQGAVDYLNMPNFTSIKNALVAGNSEGAVTAIIQSPWAASHYGNGASFSNDYLPAGTKVASGALPTPKVKSGGKIPGTDITSWKWWPQGSEYVYSTAGGYSANLDMTPAQIQKTGGSLESFTGDPGSALNGVTSQGTDNQIAAAGNLIDSIPKFLAFITDPTHLERLGYILLGIILGLVGIYILVGADKEYRPQLVENVTP